MLLATRIVLAKLNGSWNDISLPLIPLILPARSAIRLEALSSSIYLSIYLPHQTGQDPIYSIHGLKVG